MNWIDPVPEPAFSWSNHSWGSAMDVSLKQSKTIKKWLEATKNDDHLHISFISKPRKWKNEVPKSS